MEIISIKNLVISLADPEGGAPGAPPPPNGCGPMILIFDNAQNAIFSHFFSSLAINLKHNFNRNMAKTR